MVLIALFIYLTYKIVYTKLGLQRTKLWEPVQKYSECSLSTWLQSHLMSLTSSFHDSKETGEIHQALRDAKSIIKLVETVCFEVAPNSIDLMLAFAYLSSAFGPYVGLVTAYTAIAFVYATAKIVAKRADPYRAYVDTHRKDYSLGYQGLDNWDTAQVSTETGC
jgi:ABC-type transport system involved in Fe-S cluster assembly fused permease/ATPase subunit